MTEFLCKLHRRCIKPCNLHILKLGPVMLISKLPIWLCCEWRKKK